MAEKSSNIIAFPGSALPEPATVARTLGRPTRLKTWSLIVTVFGDAVLPHGGAIPAASLTRIMAGMGVGSGAVRTAISRLSADGWIERRRSGRQTDYRLAPFREAEALSAAARIYSGAGADETASPGRWAIGCLPGSAPFDAAKTDAGLYPLRRNWFAIDLEVAKIPEPMMVYEGKFLHKPDWFLEPLAPPELDDAMHCLIETFQPVRIALDSPEIPDGMTALGLRCLLIHAWRRIVLRLHDFPHEWLPSDWPRQQCHALVADIYQKLLIPSEQWLAANVWPENPLPTGEAKDLSNRFSQGY